jgi:hypothetical protein
VGFDQVGGAVGQLPQPQSSSSSHDDFPRFDDLAATQASSGEVDPHSGAQVGAQVGGFFHAVGAHVGGFFQAGGLPHVGGFSHVGGFFQLPFGLGGDPFQLLLLLGAEADSQLSILSLELDPQLSSLVFELELQLLLVGFGVGDPQLSPLILGGALQSSLLGLGALQSSLLGLGALQSSLLGLGALQSSLLGLGGALQSSLFGLGALQSSLFGLGLGPNPKNSLRPEPHSGFSHTAGSVGGVHSSGSCQSSVAQTSDGALVALLDQPYNIEFDKEYNQYKFEVVRTHHVTNHCSDMHSKDKETTYLARLGAPPATSPASLAGFSFRPSVQGIATLACFSSGHTLPAIVIPHGCNFP